MSTVIIPHLGPSIPTYFADCLHQLRLWNKETAIYIILDPVHKGTDFWVDCQTKYNVIYCYTDTLSRSTSHQIFLDSYEVNKAFRQGYWQYVMERFFYYEELMRRENLTNCITMEYDVLVYTDLTALTSKLAATPTCRMVRDYPKRGHPGFFYIPHADAIGDICKFIQSRQGTDDMTLLAMYAIENPIAMNYLPAITEARNKSVIPRVSKNRIHTDPHPFYLSQDSEYFNTLFDSAVVGQYICGVDPRNKNGQKCTEYINESALYQFTEMPFMWTQINGLWQPQLDGCPLATIHVHSKALSSFVSDRPTVPTADYSATDLLKTLVKN